MNLPMPMYTLSPGDLRSRTATFLPQQSVTHRRTPTLDKKGLAIGGIIPIRKGKRCGQSVRGNPPPRNSSDSRAPPQGHRSQGTCPHVP